MNGKKGKRSKTLNNSFILGAVAGAAVVYLMLHKGDPVIIQPGPVDNETPPVLGPGSNYLARRSGLTLRDLRRTLPANYIQ